MAIKSDNILVRNDNLIDSIIDEETILLSVVTSKYYGMDSVASRIWSLLQNPTTLERIISTLIQEYDISEEKCAQDVEEFLTELINEKIVKCIHE
jgi:hypothetical protein